MKKQILQLGKALSRAELQKINGGGTCAYYNSQSNCISSGLSSQQAQGRLSHENDHWCCNSCGTASWGSAPSCGPNLNHEIEQWIEDEG